MLANSDSKFWSDSNEIVEVYKEEPIFEGQFSNESYQERVYEAIENFNEQNKRNILSDWENIIFHLPYAFHGRRMIINNEKKTSIRIASSIVPTRKNCRDIFSIR